MKIILPNQKRLHTQGLNCNFLYNGILVAFDNCVKIIVMRKCIVSHGTIETTNFWFTYDRQPAAAVATHRWNCEQKAPDVEILCGRDCGLWVLKGPSVPSRCSCTGTYRNCVPFSSPEINHCSYGERPENAKSGRLFHRMTSGSSASGSWPGCHTMCQWDLDRDTGARSGSRNQAGKSNLWKQRPIL